MIQQALSRASVSSASFNARHSSIDMAFNRSGRLSRTRAMCGCGRAVRTVLIEFGSSRSPARVRMDGAEDPVGERDGDVEVPALHQLRRVVMAVMEPQPADESALADPAAGRQVVRQM